MNTERAMVALGWRRRIWSEELIETVRRWSGIDDHPEPGNRRRRAGIRIFRSDFVERWFSKAHPVMPIVWTGPFMVWGLYRGFVQGRTSPFETLGLVLLGIFLWTLVEYVLHRWIFHWQPPGDGGKMWSFMVHGYHHEFPDDKMRLVAPPLMLIFFGIIVWAIYAAVFGPDRFLQVFAGTCMGYVAYDWIHYYTHHFHPKGGVGRWLQQYHLRHHFQEDGIRYGISSPIWDLLLGTYRSPRR